ncbi:hypothetical protein SO802_016016 [Lithocarpus litseifolius]|uniref:RNase H type-1 domain-containing protein n=1 Tax=Lithocarpus litseifolius TaxID=425828 RepID=A0AAW2CVA9_9ROSI
MEVLPDSCWLVQRLRSRIEHPHSYQGSYSVDARAVLDVITSLACSNSLITPLVEDCKQLASCIPRIRFIHCYREANRSADKLARMGAVQQRPFSIFLSPPVEVLNIFNSDLFGETIARACPESMVSV